MNVLFEEFIGRTLQQLFRSPDLQVTLQGPRRHVLSESQTGIKRFRTQPDIVIQQGGRPRVVIDTKWKRLKGEIEDARRGVGQADVYQMLAYGEVYDARDLILLYPHHSNLGPTAGVLGCYEVFGSAKRTLTVATVSLEDLKRVPAQLGTLLSAHLSRTLSAAAA
jgi:5-methylcytosine-specific restriction enzyme subunit McrC